MKTKNGISLIVLVLTIIVLSILATAVIITLNNTNIMSEARKTTFKSDMASFKEAYELYKIGLFADNPEYDVTEINATYNDTTFKEIFGENVSEKYNSLQIVGGKLIYESTDEMETEISKELGMAREVISKNESYIGYYADIDGDGDVDGIIFADLCIGGSGEYLTHSDTNELGEIIYESVAYSIPTVNKTTVKDYTISQTSYSVEGATGYAEKPVLKAVGSGDDRFYIMALKDECNSDNKYYYQNASSGITDWNTISSASFGSGKSNTHTMIERWNGDYYGAKSNSDIWYYIEDKVYGEADKTLENVKWFVPSISEWSAFFELLIPDITDSNGESDLDFGLKNKYFTSTLVGEYEVRCFLW